MTGYIPTLIGSKSRTRSSLAQNLTEKKEIEDKCPSTGLPPSPTFLKTGLHVQPDTLYHSSRQYTTRSKHAAQALRQWRLGSHAFTANPIFITAWKARNKRKPRFPRNGQIPGSLQGGCATVEEQEALSVRLAPATMQSRLP